MIIRLSAAHEEPQVIPLLLKERSGVVDWDGDAGTRHPLPPHPARRGVVFMPGRRLTSGPQRTGKGVKCKKDVKIEGTNSISALESTKVSKNELKTNWF